MTKNLKGQIAQSVEQRTENPRVGGSIPSLTTSKPFEKSRGFLLILRNFKIQRIPNGNLYMAVENVLRF